ncbi:MAG: hypothetical protein KME23_12940 [Goleter apudmare HA4340-LM2]|jgi:hypothetical protein|nr:hypothetical protein [Goleter apudmare HA4340-LM2]
MAKVVISVLYPHAIKAFIHNITPEQAETILGGTYPYSFFVMNTSDSLYIGATRADQRLYAVGAYSTNVSDNKYDTVDYSRSILNTFIY